MNKGIDYSMGKSNFDQENGIHYGVISQHSIMMEAMDDFEYIYPGPFCPKCGNDAQDITDFSNANPDIDIEEWEKAKYDSDDFVCQSCKYMFGSESAYSEESSGFKYENDGYILTDCLDTDIFVLKSPYYTFSQFCSPCVPGAGNLDTSIEDGVKTYALGHDWFEDGKATYRVFDVMTDKEVLPE